MTGQDAAAVTHVVAATSGLVFGAVVLAGRKGTSRHRRIGAVYAALLVLVNVAALSLHRDATFGIFHWLAVLSLATLVVGLVPMLWRRQSHRVVTIHAFCMPWSYAGLVAAGTGQLAAGYGPASDAAVPVAVGVALSACAVVIAWRVPLALASLPRAGGQRA